MARRVFTCIVALSVLLAANCCLVLESAHRLVHPDEHSSSQNDNTEVKSNPCDLCHLGGCPGASLAFTEKREFSPSDDLLFYASASVVDLSSVFSRYGLSSAKLLENMLACGQWLRMLASLTRAAIAPPLAYL